MSMPRKSFSVTFSDMLSMGLALIISLMPVRVSMVDLPQPGIGAPS
jgi:hypothetical protein